MLKAEDHDYVAKQLNIFQDLKRNELVKYQKAIKDVTHRKNQLIEECELYADSLIQTLTKQWMKLNENLTKYEKHFNDEKNILDGNKTYAILPVEHVSNFERGTSTAKNIGDVFGSLDKTEKLDLELTLIQSHDAPLSYINPICPTNENTAILGCAADQKVVHMQLETKVDILQLYQLDVCSIVLLQSGEFIFTSAKNETSVKLVTNTGAVHTFYEFEPLVPKALCITSENEIIVGLREATPNPFLITRSSKRQVRKLDVFGRTRKIYEFDAQQNRLLTLPTAVASDSNSIFVLDSLDRDNGRILALSEDGKLSWLYKGYPLSNFRFCPNDMIVTTRGIIILTDTYNDALHFLNTDGSLLLFRKLTEFGINLPCSVGMDFRERLWVGTGKTDGDKAKFHILSMYSN